MFSRVPLTFLIFMGSAEPVPRKMTSGYRSALPAQHTRWRPHFETHHVHRDIDPSSNQQGTGVLCTGVLVYLCTGVADASVLAEAVERRDLDSPDRTLGSEEQKA